MWQNTKLLIFFSIAVSIFGFGLLWFGLRSETSVLPSPSPVVAPIAENLRVATGAATEGTGGEQALVTRVMDGDTIVVDGESTVRFVGMDTPETVDPRRPVGCFGKEASDETKKLLAGKIVILQKDISETDKFGRLLRLIYLPLENGQTLFVNDYLVREGFAKVKTYRPDIKFENQFLDAEKQARENKKGLWGKCN